jgi:hypothetical protein
MTQHNVASVSKSTYTLKKKNTSDTGVAVQMSESRNRNCFNHPQVIKISSKLSFESSFLVAQIPFLGSIVNCWDDFEVLPWFKLYYQFRNYSVKCNKGVVQDCRVMYCTMYRDQYVEYLYHLIPNLKTTGLDSRFVVSWCAWYKERRNGGRIVYQSISDDRHTPP